jgi:adenosylmethionine-8-amino-7-oxononanoate aminotransferase
MINGLIHSMIVCPEVDRDYPCIVNGQGVYLYDTAGRHYIDASGGSAAVSNLGHGITEIAEIIRLQTSKVAIIPTHAFSCEETEHYLTKLVAFAPPGFKRAWTVMSGTEAVENAAKLALQYHQLNGNPERYKIISRWNSYHGNSIFTLDIGGMKYRRQSYAKWLNNFPHISPAYMYRKGEGLNEEEYRNECMNELVKCIEENDPATIAAFVAEPVVGAALGAVPPPAGYFKDVREICDRYGILFIADEVMTGFGRLGTNFGVERFDTVPDIIAAGKGISGGYYPLSAIIASEKIAQVYEEKKAPFLGGHTFACNPVGAAVGNFVIDYMRNRHLAAHARDMGEYFMEQLRQSLGSSSIVGDVRGLGLLLGIEIVKDKTTKEPFPPELQVSKLVFYEAIRKGIILYPGKGSVNGIAGDHILMSPPLCIQKSEINQVVDVLKQSLDAVESGILFNKNVSPAA